MSELSVPVFGRVHVSVLGLDMSLSASGLCLPSGQMMTISTLKMPPTDLRLTHIRREVAYVLDTTKPHIAVMEDVPNMVRSKRALFALLNVQGIVQDQLAVRRIPLIKISNKSLKKYATGNGGADKTKMIAACQELNVQPGDDNQADAWWLRAMGLHAYGYPASTSHMLSTDMIRKLEWPDLPHRTCV